LSPLSILPAARSNCARSLLRLAFKTRDLIEEQATRDNRYLEFFRVPATLLLSVVSRTHSLHQLGGDVKSNAVWELIERMVYDLVPAK
jgi:hypothetical protein